MGLILKQETSVQAGFLFGGILKGFSHNEIPLVAAETADIVGSPWAADEVVGGQFVVRGRDLFIF